MDIRRVKSKKGIMVCEDGPRCIIVNFTLLTFLLTAIRKTSVSGRFLGEQVI